MLNIKEVRIGRGKISSVSDNAGGRGCASYCTWQGGEGDEGARLKCS